MAKFRKRPGIIEAEQFFTKKEPWPKGVFKANCLGGALAVTTIHNNTVRLEDGDWIIPEPDGEHYYPCKPDIFAETYELVEE